MGTLKDAIMGGPKPIIQVPIPKSVVLNCDKHGEYIAIECCTPEGKKVQSKCPECEHAELRKERHERYADHKRREAEHAAMSVFRESSMPKIFSKVGFDDYKTQGKDSAAIKNRLVKYAENFNAISENGACALLIGNTGTGKTMLAAAVANYVMNNGYTAFYTKCPRALARVKHTWSPSVLETQEDEINKYRKPDLLIMDEIPKGCKSANDWEVLHDILDRRTEDRKPTISISTLTIKELKQKIGDEVFRRLHHKGAILEFNWSTYQEEHLF